MKVVPAVLCLTLAIPAFASWWPTVSPQQVNLNVGESATVRITPTWSGLVDYGGIHWTFCTANQNVAEGCVQLDNATPRDLLIYARAPGYTTVRQYPSGSGDWAQVSVNCPVEPPSVAAAANLRTEIDQPVSLTVISPFAERTVFHWYLGTIGDTSHPLDAAGRQLAFRPTTPGQHDVWVNAMTICSTSSVQFRVDVPPAKRRATRH